MKIMRKHSAVLRDNDYIRVGQSNKAHNRPVCPKCKKYYLRSLWTRSVVYGKNYPHKMGKTEIVIGRWCQGCGYFTQTYKKPEGAK